MMCALVTWDSQLTQLIFFLNVLWIHQQHGDKMQLKTFGFYLNEVKQAIQE